MGFGKYDCNGFNGALQSSFLLVDAIHLGWFLCAHICLDSLTSVFVIVCVRVLLVEWEGEVDICHGRCRCLGCGLQGWVNAC